MGAIRNRRCDIFLMVMIFLYFVILMGMWLSELPASLLEVSIYGWIFLLVVGVIIKEIRNPWKRWFNEEIIFFKGTSRE